MIERVEQDLGRTLNEVPVGFKWFGAGFVDGSFGFGGEASAGASFLRKDGTVWTTDKDGIILDLLAAEITALTGRDPGLHYQDLAAKFGAPVYKRIDAKANSAQKNVLKNLAPDDVKAAVTYCARDLATDGTGLLIRPSHRLMTDIPLENVSALLEAFRALGQAYA